MKIINKPSRVNYQLISSLETGISLTGQEASSIRMGRVDITKSYVKIIGTEAYLINTNIPEVKEPKRTRKLLLHKRQILSLDNKVKQQKLTLIPLAIYTKGRLIKLEVALAKPRRRHEKKEALKRRDLDRELESELFYSKLGTNKVSTKK